MKKFIIFILVFINFTGCVFAEENDKIIVFTNAIDNEIKQGGTNKRISELYTYRAFVFENEEHDDDKAFADYIQAVKYNPNDTYALFKVSKFKSKFGDDEGALIDVKKILILEPTNANYHYLAAVLYGKLKNCGMAINECTEAIKLKPKFPEAFKYRGICEIALGKNAIGFKDLGYAKQQFFENNDIENYKSTVEIINLLKSEQNSIQVDNKDNSTTKELRNINYSLHRMNVQNYLK